MAVRREGVIMYFISRYYRRRWGNLKKNPPPYNITLTKGSLFVAVTRGFVDFVLHNPIAHDFKEWLAHTIVPDETFFSSLNHNPQLGVPGADKSKFTVL